MTLAELLPLKHPIHIADIGASAIGEDPHYKRLLDHGLARLSAFDADPRQKDAILALYGERATVYTQAIGDGETHTLYLASRLSGMSSLLKPSARHLGFFNGFDRFGHIESEETLQTMRLDDVEGLAGVDYLKMDIQGAELVVLSHAERALSRCVAIQLEVSFVPLYENQPTFGEIDLWMRANGFVPHCFTDIKRWSIRPTIRDNNFRVAFNQLLEADIVYIRDPVEVDRLSDDQLAMMALIAQHAYRSTDLAVYALLQLERRERIPTGSAANFLESVSAQPAPPSAPA